MLHRSYSSEPVMILHYQILLKSPPLTLLAGSVPDLRAGPSSATFSGVWLGNRQQCVWQLDNKIGVKLTPLLIIRATIPSLFLRFVLILQYYVFENINLISNKCPYL